MCERQLEARPLALAMSACASDSDSESESESSGSLAYYCTSCSRPPVTKEYICYIIELRYKAVQHAHESRCRGVSTAWRCQWWPVPASVSGSQQGPAIASLSVSGSVPVVAAGCVSLFHCSSSRRFNIRMGLSHSTYGNPSTDYIACAIRHPSRVLKLFTMCAMGSNISALET